MKKYKHYLGFGGALLGLFLSASVLASELDWDKSNIIINFTPEISGMALSCPLAANNSITLAELGLNTQNPSQSLVFDLTTLPCFQTAGTYNVLVELWDTAGNPSTQNYPQFIITAADPDPTTSTIPGNCPSRIADSVDACGFNLTLRDEFDNLVTQVEKVQIYSPSGNILNEANKGLLFRDGLRLDGFSLPSNASREFTGISQGAKSFPLVALAPTVQMATEGDMAIYKPEIIKLGIKTPSINNDGTVATNFNIALIDNKEISVHFTPPFQIVPKISEDTHIELDSPFEVNFELSAVEDLTPDITKFSNIEAIDIENLEGHNFTPEGSTSSSLPASFSYDSINTPPPYTTEHLVSPIIVSAEDTIDAFFSVISRISYTLGEETIMYPAGGFGEAKTLGIQAEIDTNTPLVGYAFDSAEVEIIGFVVEGGAIRGKSEDQMFLLDGEGKRMAHIGAIDETDIRSAVSQNAFELLRGAEAESFSADNHVIVKTGNVTLNDVVGANAPSGRNTLVIKNGNLIIDQNFTYASSNTDSFGVMLINDDVNDRATGNIFIRDNVQKIVGTFYADGGIMANATNDVANGNNDNPYQKKQLLLTGMLLTKNTKGGSITLNETTGKFYTPWGEGIKAEAKIYDLDYVRRYNYRGNPEDAVPGETSNDASFILRMDKKASVLPPPGFEISGTIQQ